MVIDSSDIKAPNFSVIRRPRLWDVILYNSDTEMENNIPFILQDIFKKEATESYILWLSSALNGEQQVFRSSYDIAKTLAFHANDELVNTTCYSVKQGVLFRAVPS